MKSEKETKELLRIFKKQSCKKCPFEKYCFDEDLDFILSCTTAQKVLELVLEKVNDENKIKG